MPRFEICVIEANNLPAADLSGKSDPYIEVCTAAGRQKTDVKKSTLNPVWRENKTVSLANPSTDGIGFLVYDWDRIGANDIIAYGYISVIGVPLNGAPLDAWVELYKKGKKNKDKKAAKKAVKAGHPPKPGVPGGRLHLTVRALDVAPPPRPMAPPMAPSPMPPPGQPYPPPAGYPPQPMPGQPYPPPAGYPPQPMPGQPYPPPAGYPPQPMPGQPYPPPAGYPPQPYPPAGYPPPGYPPQPMAPPPVYGPAPGAMMTPPLVIQSPYRGAIPCGFQNKSGFLRPKKTDAEVAGKVVGKGAKKTLKVIGKLLT